MNKKERAFQSFVLDWFEKSGRHDLPWRATIDPYQILVSELMLQQTQVVRVIPKYQAFISKFPTVEVLAQASLGTVLRHWQGLGYNRRAKFLHQCAVTVTNEYAGQFPVTEDKLRNLPGIGPYTAAAICAFAHNQPVLLIETNVRQVIVHHFFNRHEQVTDAQILEIVARTLPRDKARIWYAALMDYGSHLKSLHGNNTQKVKGYSKQSKFKGSDREVRGAVLRSLAQGAKSGPALEADLVPLEPVRIRQQLQVLQAESLVIWKNHRWCLP